jgi:nucleoside diphosphate kinase
MVKVAAFNPTQKFARMALRRLTTRVVVFVVAGDQAIRQTRELIGIQSQRADW